MQRPAGAKLLAIDARGRLRHLPRAQLAGLLREGDVVVANDAATLPASLTGTHLPSGLPIEIRLAGHDAPAAERCVHPAARSTIRPGCTPPDRATVPEAAGLRSFCAIAFGAGDHRTPTEDRAAPPPLAAGDRLALGPLSALIVRLLGHPRFICLRFEGDPDAVRAGIARHGRPIQYAHVDAPLQLWDVWTPVAAMPVAFEPPSAGFVIDWRLLDTLQRRGVGFATLTHAAGISSTGDAALDARLPLPEPYHLPASTCAAIDAAKRRGGRVIAVGTTVVRALEDAAAKGWRPGSAVASQRIGADARLAVVDALVSGTHAPGTSHRELLRAFADDAVLERADAALDAHDYLTHEFGDSILIERSLERARLQRADDVAVAGRSCAVVAAP